MNPETGNYFFHDPKNCPPPLGRKILLLTHTGVCVIGKWEPTGYLGWHELPKITQEMKMAGHHKCLRCRQIKPMSEFGPCKATASGLFHYCRPCTAEYQREHRKKVAALKKKKAPIVNESAKLETSDIPIIFELHNSGLKCVEIARKFEVTDDTIRNVITRKTWRNVQI